MNQFLSQISNLQEEVKTLDSQAVFSKSTPTQWSITGVIEHILRVEKGVSKVIGYEQASEKHEQTIFPEEKMKEILENRTMKFEAPDLYRPDGSLGNQEELVKKLEDLRKNLQEITLEMDLLVLAAPHPRLGKMTKQDWLNFMFAHFNRHLAQIKEIKEKIQA